MRVMSAVVFLAFAGCSSTVSGGTLPLSGDWTATVNSLGIADMTITIVEQSGTLTATGQWAPIGSATTRPFTASGLHFESGLSMVFTFDTQTGPALVSTTGEVESATSFYVVFPDGVNPVRVIFRRR